MRQVLRRPTVEKWRVCNAPRQLHVQRNRTPLWPSRVDPCVCNARDGGPTGERSGRLGPAIRSLFRPATERQESGLEFQLDAASPELGRDPHSRFSAFCSRADWRDHWPDGACQMRMALERPPEIPT